MLSRPSPCATAGRTSGCFVRYLPPYRWFATMVSKSGDALPQKGDLLGQAGPVKVGSAALKLEIREQVKE